MSEYIRLLSTVIKDFMLDPNTDWKFQNELFLENFISETLEPLFNLKYLARQHYLSNQVCDILAINQKRQLTILELKNTEDRYIIQQLTRYYDAVQEHQPFQEEVDYQLPIRLVAISPQFHLHNLIDQKYNRLTFELFTFRILATEADSFCFELSQINDEPIVRLDIPKKFHPFLCRNNDEENSQPLPYQLPPPKSLQKLTEALSPQQQAYVLAVREQLLCFDERMIELGKTTRTMYGLRKGDKNIYKTKLCAEFIPTNSITYSPRLMLRLPYPKRERAGSFYKKERVKGLAWVEIRHEQEWNPNTAIRLFFYLGKSRNNYRYACDLNTYSNLYHELTGEKKSLQKLDDLLTLSLQEWKLQLDSQDIK